VQDDGRIQLPPQRMVRHDAEIAADIDKHGADRPAADFGGDLLRRGQARQARIGLRGWFGLLSGGAWCAL
jgi:hypothetical protein